MLARHLTDADHPDRVWGHRLVVEGCIHEGTGAWWRSLVVFGCHRIMCLQKGLWAAKRLTYKLMMVIVFAHEKKNKKFSHQQPPLIVHKSSLLVLVSAQQLSDTAETEKH